MVSLKIVDEKGKEVDPDELTDIGIGQIIFECNQMKERLEEIHNQQSDDEDDDA